VLLRGFSSWAGAITLGENTLGESPRTDEPQVCDRYIGNPVAQRALRQVAQTVGCTCACTRGAGIAWFAYPSCGCRGRVAQFVSYADARARLDYWPFAHRRVGGGGAGAGSVDSWEFFVLAFDGMTITSLSVS